MHPTVDASTRPFSTFLHVPHVAQSCLPALSSCLGVDSVAPAFQKTLRLTPLSGCTVGVVINAIRPFAHVLARPSGPLAGDDPTVNLPSSVFLTAHQTDFQVFNGSGFALHTSHPLIPPAAAPLVGIRCITLVTAPPLTLTLTLTNTNTKTYLGYKSINCRQRLHPNSRPRVVLTACALWFVEPPLSTCPITAASSTAPQYPTARKQLQVVSSMIHGEAAPLR